MGELHILIEREIELQMTLMTKRVGDKNRRLK